MIRLFIDSMPIAKQRHRSGRMNGRTVTYDPQKAEKMKTKWLLSTQLREQGHLKPLEGPIELWITSFYPWPKSWSKKRLKTAKETGSLKTSKPDLDNIEKFYADVLTGIAWKDDAQVVQSWSEKRYSDKCGVEIIFKPKEVHMVNEHAITISKSCSIEQISYLVKKANQLGKKDRDIVRVFTKEDEEGSHIIFEVTDMKPRGMR